MELKTGAVKVELWYDTVGALEFAKLRPTVLKREHFWLNWYLVDNETPICFPAEANNPARRPDRRVEASTLQELARSLVINGVSERDSAELVMQVNDRHNLLLLSIFE